MGIGFIITGLCILCVSIVLLLRTHKINEDVANLNKILEKEQISLKLKKGHLEKEQISLKLQKDTLQKEIANLSQQAENQRQQLQNYQNDIFQIVEKQKELSKQAFENYFKVLEKKYMEVEEEHDMEINALQTHYKLEKLKLDNELDECKNDLDKIKSTRAAAIEAQRKEKEIQENKTFYCLKVSDIDIKDITVLESIKPKLTNPRTLSMLIWQSYFRTPMTQLCNNVIGVNKKTGIYKITNILTNECYIGQAVDLAARWKDHAKASLGVDTPKGSKLYKAVMEHGLWNFSWEVLEECSREQLNEKERFYIDLYQSVPYGYNILSAPKR